MNLKELIPGLPNDVATECLVRVPLLHSFKLGMVCKLWKSAAAHRCFTRRRRQLLLSRSNNIPGEGGQFMVLFQEDIEQKKKNAGAGVHCRLILYDIVKRVWRCESLLGNFPAATLPKCCVISMTREKLVVMGDLTTLECPFDDEWASLGTSVWVYHFSKGEWQKGAPMPGPRRLFFAHASDGVGTIFVAGGRNPVTGEPLRSAMAYDVERDEWSPLPLMLEKRSSCLGIIFDNTFLVLTVDCCSEAFDLTTFSWRVISNSHRASAAGHETFLRDEVLKGTDFSFFSSSCNILLLTKPMNQDGYIVIHLTSVLDLEHSHIELEALGSFAINEYAVDDLEEVAEEDGEEDAEEDEDDAEERYVVVLPKKYSAVVRGFSLTNFLMQKLYDNFRPARFKC